MHTVLLLQRRTERYKHHASFQVSSSILHGIRMYLNLINVTSHILEDISSGQMFILGIVITLLTGFVGLSYVQPKF